MKKLLCTVLAAAAALLHGETSQASDHVDGIKTAVDNAGDISDAFAFMSPRDPNKVVLIMNVHTAANSRSRFSDAVDYKFRIRPIDDARTLAPSNDASRERSIVCNFDGGMVLVAPGQRATCTFNLGGEPEKLTFETRTRDFKAGGATQKNGLRAFAGARSDPWFLDLGRTIKFVNSLPVEQEKGRNGLHGFNVLSIVVEVDKSRLPAPLVAVTAQTIRH